MSKPDKRRKYDDAFKAAALRLARESRLTRVTAHQPAALYEVFEPARAHALLQRVEFMFTPKHGSWLDMAEIEFAALLIHGLPERVADRSTRTRRLGRQLATSAVHQPTGSLPRPMLALSSNTFTRQLTRFNLLVVVLVFSPSKVS